MGEPGARIAAHRECVFTRRSLDRLAPHIGEVYGVQVTSAQELDAGVMRLDMAGREPWVARVFNAVRSAAAVRSDAAVLRHIADFGFPAERVADDEPVSVLDGQQVLITTFVEGGNGRGDQSVELSRSQGDLLGRLHALPTPTGGEVGVGGAWHGLSPNGGTRDADVNAAVALLEDAAALHPELAEAYRSLRDAVASLDTHRDLPQALTHPDFTGPNMLLMGGGNDPVVVDWTGSGIGPRVLSLGMILGRGGFGPEHVDAIAGAYRQHIELEPEEFDRLPDAIAAFSLLMMSWMAIFQPDRATRVAGRVADEQREADDIASRFREALR